MRRWLFLIGSTWCFLACDYNRFFEEYRPVDRKGWHRDTALVFTFDLKNTHSRYNIYLNVRNKGNYAYRNIWLSVETLFPDNQAKTDTIEFVLADPSGKWIGTGFGGLFERRMPYVLQYRFPQSGTCRMLVRHRMRPEKLKGIQDVGVRIEKSL